jgi:hypothetical protein
MHAADQIDVELDDGMTVMVKQKVRAQRTFCNVRGLIVLAAAAKELAAATYAGLAR